MPAPQHPASNGPSFVPHSAPIKKRGRDASSLLTALTFLLFVVSAALAAGVYFYDGYLTNRLESKKKEVAKVESKVDFRSAEDLIRLSKRLGYSRDLLSQHVAVSPFFTELEKVTLPSIRFTSVDLDRSTENPTVKLSGEASGYPSIALQSDEFGKTTVFRDPIFSSLKTNDDGTVTFELEMTVDRTLFAFTNSL